MARLQPPAGRILHGAGQSADAFSEYVRVLRGIPPAVYMTYTGLRGDFNAWEARLRAQLDVHAPWQLIPQIGLSMTTDGSPEKHYEQDVAAGAYDAAIESFCLVLKRLARPTFVRIGYEFNGQWNGYQAETFVAAWRRIVTAMRRHGLDEVATVWCYAPDGNAKDFAAFHPGAELVDWWSIDLFSDWHFTAPDTIAFMEAAAKAQAPVMIGECTPRYIGVRDGASSWDRWFAAYFAFFDRWPGVQATSYIAWDWSSYPMWADWGDGRVWADPVVLERYRAAMSQPRWIHAAPAATLRPLLGLP